MLHGFTEYYNFIPAKDALLLTFLYLAASLLIAGLFWLFYKNFSKASLIAFFIMAYHFFFGSVQDYLKDHFPGAFITRYSFILPVSFLFFIVVIVGLKKRKKPFVKFVLYLNILLLLLLTADTGWLFTKIFSKKESSSFQLAKENLSICDTCKKPDIYFILLDEYTGNTALKDQFDFDNISFETTLMNKGFHVVKDSRSNYNSTPFSIASTLNMCYLDLDMKTKSPGNLNNVYHRISDNLTVKYLAEEGYQFYNFSIFDFRYQHAIRHDDFLPAGTKLITSQTFLSRLINDIRFNIVSGKWRFRPALKRFTADHLHNNEIFLKLTKDIAAQKTLSPKFIYTHLMMPHSPFYFDSKGNAVPIDSLVENPVGKEKGYVEYLQYCNKRILELVDQILAASPEPPVIMLLGDHGSRRFKKHADEKYYFLNLNAIYLPDKNYGSFYDSMSNVNQFRVLFNTQFHQHLPMQWDSTIFLWK